MRIAVAQDNRIVSGHFGHCEGFALYAYDNGVAEFENVLANPGHEPGFLPKFLRENKVDVVIAGGMGGRAQDLFKEQGIEVIVGASGSIDDVVELYTKSALKSTGAVCSAHDHKGDCGEH
jgi:predicted Fe-Mo cluster-binding NifX family protein